MKDPAPPAAVLDDDCWDIIVSLLGSLEGFTSHFFAITDLLALAQVCRQTRRAAANGLRALDAASEPPACRITFLRLGYGSSGLYSCCSDGEEARFQPYFPTGVNVSRNSVPVLSCHGNTGTVQLRSNANE